MTIVPSCHDGHFDGLCLADGGRVHLFVRKVGGERLTIVLTGVERLNVGNIWEGNIIFDLLVVKPEAVTSEHILRAWPFADEPYKARLLNEVLQQNLCVLEINSSYGVEGAALFRNVDVLSGYVLA